jgi:hypothetical protein
VPATERTCRLITLIALDGPAPVPARRLPAIDATAEERLFGVAARTGWSEFEESGWRPPTTAHPEPFAACVSSHASTPTSAFSGSTSGAVKGVRSKVRRAGPGRFL